MSLSKQDIAKHVNEVCIKANCLMCAEADRYESYKQCPYLSLKQTARTRKVVAEDVPDELVSAKTGQLVTTKSIAAAMDDSQSFYEWVMDCLDRYKNNDWGDLCDEDKASNDKAVEKGEGRVLAAYKYPKTGEKVYIITEADRSVTTVLFADEY